LVGGEDDTDTVGFGEELDPVMGLQLEPERVSTHALSELFIGLNQSSPCVGFVGGEVETRTVEELAGEGS
jgi:hypothetical protein